MTKKEKIEIGYNAIHSYLRKNNGNAKYCSNPACNSINPKRFEWALIKGRTYSKNIIDYIPLCPSCHRKYDNDYRKGENQHCSKLKENDIYELREHLINKGSIYSFAKIKNVSPENINAIISGRTWRHIDIKWDEIYKPNEKYFNSKTKKVKSNVN